MKLLVTGGAGFIGSNFVHYWLKQHPQDKIVVLDALTYAGNLENLALVKDQIKFIEGDITNPVIVDQAMTGCDMVVHFAAETHVDRSIANPEIFNKTNVEGTKVLLDAALKHQVKRFHHISTDEVFGDIPLNKNYKFNELSTYNPSSPYADSKAKSDQIVRSYYEEHNLPITITNCSNNFGPYQYPEKFIPRSIIRLLSDQNIRLYTPGNQVRDWLFVDDHCRAIDLVLNEGKIGETYCVGGMTEEISNRQVAEQLLKILKLPANRIELVTDRPKHDVKYAIDWSKINRELGWQPEHDFSEWLQTTVQWYKDNRAWWVEHFSVIEDFYANAGEKVLT